MRGCMHPADLAKQDRRNVSAMVRWNRCLTGRNVWAFQRVKARGEVGAIVGGRGGASIFRPFEGLWTRRRERRAGAMSALPPKADMCGATADVCFGPVADIASFTRSPRRRWHERACYCVRYPI